jgi:hypothetical protein
LGLTSATDEIDKEAPGGVEEHAAVKGWSGGDRAVGQGHSGGERWVRWSAREGARVWTGGGTPTRASRAAPWISWRHGCHGEISEGGHEAPWGERISGSGYGGVDLGRGRGGDAEDGRTLALAGTPSTTTLPENASSRGAGTGTGTSLGPSRCCPGPRAGH